MSQKTKPFSPNRGTKQHKRRMYDLGLLRGQMGWKHVTPDEMKDPDHKRGYEDGLKQRKGGRGGVDKEDSG